VSAHTPNSGWAITAKRVGHRAHQAPFHPYLFALYPIVFLYAQNADSTDPALLIRPFVVAAIVAVLLVFAYWSIVRDAHTASCMASVALIGFFTLWSPITRDFLAVEIPIRGWNPLFPKIAYVAIISFVTVWIGIRRPVPSQVTSAINASAVVIFVMACWPLRLEIVAPFESDDVHPVASLTVMPDAGGSVNPRPNVFFIILDAYGRQDVLLEEYGFDNSPFLESMQDKGFLVVGESLADYDNTLQSLASCLQMNYLNDSEVLQTKDTGLRQLMYEGPVHSTFRAQGYRVCAISPGFSMIEPTRAVDVLVRPGLFAPVVGQFEGHVINLTPLPEISKLFDKNIVNYMWRQKLLHSIQNIETPLSMGLDKPVFVQAHILCPHAPYVFDSEGNAYESSDEFTLSESGRINMEQARREYVAQVRGLNQHIERAIDHVLAASTEPPIIIVVSDHGPPKPITTAGGRQANLCLLHLPGIDSGQIPQDLHLVNVFRLVFKLYFDADLPLLETPLHN
jgi:hypothetical protein